MRVVLSRKGFDTSFGGIPSPILEDGRMVTLPIPALKDEVNRIKYNQLYFGKDEKIVELMTSLRQHTYGYYEKKKSCKKKKRVCHRFKSECAHAHLDPDLLRITYRPRLRDWERCFGPSGKKYLLLNNVGKLSEGDIFLFFGWFQKVIRDRNGLKFDPQDCNAKYEGKHRIFGYLQIGRKYTVDKDRLPKWVHYHPHVGGEEDEHNIIFVARSSLELKEKRKLPGAGIFKYDEKQERNPMTKLTLTKSDHCMTQWELPFKGIQCWVGQEKPRPKREMWKTNYFQSPTYPAQELLFEQSPIIEEWAKNVICAHEVRK